MNPSPLDQEENLKKAERIAYLIAGHLRSTLTPAEQDELDDWITDSDENLELFETLTDSDNIELAMRRYLDIERGKAVALENIKGRVGLLAKKRPARKIGLFLMAALFLFAVAGLYLFIHQQPHNTFEKPSARAVGAGDVPPGSDKAVLTLSDGRTIILDTARTGLLATEGNAHVTSDATGKLVYSGAAEDQKINLIATPRGGHYQVVLSDGTRVWLNAESSLRYPVGFPNDQRKVQLRGEGYFEVAKDVTRPFTVSFTDPSGDSAMVKVLGTHFNINSYGDEGRITTTLLEGSVEMQTAVTKKVLRPGEQAILSNKLMVERADTAAVIAWKEGTFRFHNASIRTIGEQIKRWYDLDVEYDGTISQHFNTEAARQVPLSKLLEGLEGTGQVHFQLDGKKLIITP